jgi:hypothetical protein
MRNLPRQLIGLTLALISLSACAAGISDACPPVPGYDPAVREHAAEELAGLPANSAIERMLADYAVMRAQSRACH